MDVYLIFFCKRIIIMQILDFAAHSSSSHRLRNCYSCINGKSTQWGYKLLYSGHIFKMVVRKVYVNIRDYLKIISPGNYSF